jgi:hypothetical protein
LSGERTFHSSGFGAVVPGAIPWTVLDRYATRRGIEDFEEFEVLMRALDQAYLKAHAPVRPAKTANKQPRKGPRG